MKNKMVILFLYVLTLASGTSHAGSGKESGLGSSPPSSGLSFEEAEQYFNNGDVPGVDNLVNNWFHLAGAVNKEGNPFPGFPNFYNNNPQETTSYPNDVFGTRIYFDKRQALDGTTQARVDVFYSQGEMTQSNLDVTINSREATFARWMTAWTGLNYGESQAAHFSYACRLLNLNHHKIVCRITFHVDSPNLLEERFNAFNGETLGYNVYFDMWEGIALDHPQDARASAHNAP